MGKNLTQEEFVQKVNEKYNGKYEVVGEYVNAKTPIKIKHVECGTIFSMTPNKITTQNRNCTCPLCDGRKSKSILVGINDLWSTHPEIACMLKNSEDGYKYSKGSNDFADFICPYCGNIISSRIYSVTERTSLSCKFCSSGKSYPNRFMANLLKELNIDFKQEYIIHPYKYKYDFYFIINSQQYIVEMDGGIGHGNKSWGGEKDIKGKSADEIKNDICAKNNIKIIRIDCNYKKTKDRFNYIVNSILDSEFTTLFDLKNIDFKRIDTKSCSSLIIDVSNYWNDNIKSYDELQYLLGVCRDTVRRYLEIACEKGFINETFDDVLKEIRKASNKKIANSKSYKVLCNQTGEIFNSIKDAKSKTGATSLNGHLAGKHSYAGKLPDGTKLTWTKLTNEQYEQMILNEHSNECSFFM